MSNAIKWLMMELHNEGATWPDEAELCRICYEAEWYGADGREIDTDIYIERDGGLGFYEEYDDPDEISRVDYEKFSEANPNFVEKTLARRTEVQAEIAQRVKDIQKAVEDVYALAESAMMPLSFNLGGYGVVDPAGDWQSSRC